MKKRLKVIIITPWFPNESRKYNGIFVQEQARAISLYNDVSIIYAGPDFNPGFNCRLFRVTESLEDGIRIIRIEYGGFFVSLIKRWRNNRMETSAEPIKAVRNPYLHALVSIPRIIVEDTLLYTGVFRYFRQLMKEQGKPDIIHAHVFTAGVPAVILGRMHHIPVVISEHWSTFPLKTLHSIDILKARFAMNKAKRVLPVSQYLKRSIQYYGIKNELEVVPNTVNTNLFHMAPNQNSREKRDKNMLTIASLVPRKGIDYLIKALAIVKKNRQDFAYNIIGNGPLRGELEYLLAKSGLTGLVIFHGTQSKERVAELMKDSDFYVQPSLEETFGVTLIEALSCGKPVLATNVGATKELISDYNGMLVAARNVEALAESIENMLNNFQKYNRDEIARETQAKFGYQAIGENLDNIYRNIK